MTMALVVWPVCTLISQCAAKYIQTIKSTEVLCLAVSGEAPVSTGWLPMVVTTHTWLPVVIYGAPVNTVG